MRRLQVEPIKVVDKKAVISTWILFFFFLDLFLERFSRFGKKLVRELQGNGDQR